MSEGGDVERTVARAGRQVPATASIHDRVSGPQRLIQNSRMGSVDGDAIVRCEYYMRVPCPARPLQAKGLAECEQNHADMIILTSCARRCTESGSHCGVRKTTTGARVRQHDGDEGREAFIGGGDVSVRPSAEHTENHR